MALVVSNSVRRVGRAYTTGLALCSVVACSGGSEPSGDQTGGAQEGSDSRNRTGSGDASAAQGSGSGHASNDSGAGGATTSKAVPDSSEDAGQRFDYEPPAGGARADCAEVVAKTERVVRPADIIVLVDTSESMLQEIQAIETRIDEDLARELEASGIDYRLILVAEHPNSIREGWLRYGVCLGPSLGLAACPPYPNRRKGPRLQNNPPRFFQLDVPIKIALTVGTACWSTTMNLPKPLPKRRRPTGRG